MDESSEVPTLLPYGEHAASADFLTLSSFINVTAAAASTYPVANAGPAGANAYLAVLMNDSTAGLNATIPPFPEYIRTVSTVICVFILAIGLLGNSLVPVVIWKNRDLRNSTNLFLVNLALADLLVLLLTLPTALVELQGPPEVWVLGGFLCHLLPFVEQVVPHASVLTIVAISFERYIAICEPLQANYKLTKIRAVGIIVLVWVLAIIFTSPILMMSQYKMELFIDGVEKPVCMTSVDGTWDKIFHFFCMLVFFLFPLLVLIVIYIAIARHLLRHPYATTCAPSRHLQQQSQQYQLSQSQGQASQQQSSLQQKATLKSQSSIQGGNSRSNDDRNVSSSNMRSRKQVVAMLATVIVVFFVCLLPMRVFTFWYIAFATTQDIYENMGIEAFHGILWFCRVMLYLNSAVNPILYNAMSSKFREAFLRVIGAVVPGGHFHHGQGGYSGRGGHHRGHYFHGGRRNDGLFGAGRGSTLRSSTSVASTRRGTATSTFINRSLARRSSSSAYSSVVFGGVMGPVNVGFSYRSSQSRRSNGVASNPGATELTTFQRPSPLVHRQTEQILLTRDDNGVKEKPVAHDGKKSPNRGVSALVEQSGKLAFAPVDLLEASRDGDNNGDSRLHFSLSSSIRFGLTSAQRSKKWRHSHSGPFNVTPNGFASRSNTPTTKTSSLVNFISTTNRNGRSSLTARGSQRRSRTPEPRFLASFSAQKDQQQECYLFGKQGASSARSCSIVSTTTVTGASNIGISANELSPQQSQSQIQLGILQPESYPLRDVTLPMIDREVIFQVPSADGKGFETLPGRVSRVPSRSPSRSPHKRRTERKEDESSFIVEREENGTAESRLPESGSQQKLNVGKPSPNHLSVTPPPAFNVHDHERLDSASLAAEEGSPRSGRLLTADSASYQSARPCLRNSLSSPSVSPSSTRSSTSSSTASASHSSTPEAAEKRRLLAVASSPLIPRCIVSASQRTKPPADLAQV